jgi:hypothetical protein
MKHKSECEPGQFGPIYSIGSAALAKHRRAYGTPEYDRQAHGAAVEAAVLAAQASALRREVSLPNAQCASGTWHSDGADIHKAMQAKQRAALAACPARVRAARTPHDWEAMYLAAMGPGFVPSWERQPEEATPCEPQSIAA